MLQKFLICLIFSVSCAYAQSTQVKSFKDWKSEKVQLITAKINAIKQKIELEKQKQPNSPNVLGFYEKMLSQEEWNIDIAKELKVTDYIALYLKQNSSKNKFQEVASQLSATEVAEIVEAYTQTLGSESSTISKQAYQNK